MRLLCANMRHVNNFDYETQRCSPLEPLRSGFLVIVSDDFQFFILCRASLLLPEQAGRAFSFFRREQSDDLFFEARIAAERVPERVQF